MADAANAPESDVGSRAIAPVQRGIASLMHPTVLGSIIGAGGATAFVLANRVTLPGRWPAVALVAWAVALTVFAYAVLLRPRVLVDPGPPRPSAGFVYVGGIAGMLAVMALGRLALDGLGRPELQPAIVVLAVGLHFVPFAWAFRVSAFARIGWSLAAIGVVGLVLGVVAGATPVSAAAVLTGLVMLVLIALATVTKNEE